MIIYLCFRIAQIVLLGAIAFFVTYFALRRAEKNKKNN